jgi:hypothetical protein
MAYLGTKPANQIIDSTLIADGAVSTNDLANGAVTDAKIASGAINTQALSLLNASGSAPVYACRAWVNFNGTGTVAIRASGNVSSITDITTGVYAINFTTAMPDINYAVTSTAATYGLVSIDTISTTSFRFVTANATASALVDLVENHVAIFR